jgi:hypothetical protein
MFSASVFNCYSSSISAGIYQLFFVSLPIVLIFIHSFLFGHLQFFSALFDYSVFDSASFTVVVDPGKGVCADPVNRDAILGKGGTGPKGGNKERQLSLDRERDKA